MDLKYKLQLLFKYKLHLKFNMGKHKKNKTSILPFVSLCTPTFNRRPFIPYMIKCFEHQTYPKDKIEWIIIDDGTDPIEDLVKDIPQVKYFYYEEKMLLGKKRNLMHTKCSGDIIIYMDDDDYYPPERISHAVETLQENPKYLIAGSSEMHIYYDSRDAVFQCGPYKQFHSTAATFAFKKELLLQTCYDDEIALSEEQKFTKGYTIPLIQLDTLKSILVFSHRHNSLNKEKLLENPQQTKTIPSRYTVDDFIKDPILKQFYMYDMNRVLEEYEPGRPENKPRLLEQIKKMEEERARRIEEHNNMLQAQQKMLSMSNHVNKDINAIRNEFEKKLSDKNLLINELLKKVKELTLENGELKSRLTNI
jgi:glycosyltransferase involved in cell wall biosynthesis